MKKYNYNNIVKEYEYSQQHSFVHNNYINENTDDILTSETNTINDSTIEDTTISLNSIQPKLELPLTPRFKVDVENKEFDPTVINKNILIGTTNLK
jgi:hypothetical protein